MTMMNKNETVKAGRLIKVTNKHRSVFSNAKTWYYSLWVEDHNGKNERCLLLTQLELDHAQRRANKNKEDLIAIGKDDALRLESVLWDKVGRIVHVYNKKRKHWKAKPSYHAVIVQDGDGNNERCLLFTSYELGRAEHRASRNLEDITKKSFLTDLLD